MKRKIISSILSVAVLSGALVAVLPAAIIFFSSFMGRNEAVETFGAVFGISDGYAKVSIIPNYPTLRYYVRLLFDTPEFFVMFRNSFIQAIAIAAGQVIFALPSAWGFTQFRFRGRKILFLIYIILMIMPFQVTMVSSYIVLDKMNLIDTLLSIIVPNIFSAFPVFIISKTYEDLPKSLIEAAYLDGAGDFRTFLYVGIPLGMPGVFAAMTLSFIEYWNNIEQPLTFLRNKSLWTLALYLPQINADNICLSMAASAVIMMPSVIVFTAGQKYLEQGIAVSGINE